MIGLMIDDMRKYTVCILDNNDQLGQGGFCGDNGNCSIEGHSIRVPNKLDGGSNGWKSFVYKPLSVSHYFAVVIRLAAPPSLFSLFVNACTVTRCLFFRNQVVRIDSKA